MGEKTQEATGSTLGGKGGRVVVGWQEEEGDGHRGGGDPRVGKKGVSSWGERCGGMSGGFY